jgi:hypothetical protein
VDQVVRCSHALCKVGRNPSIETQRAWPSRGRSRLERSN